MIHILRGTVHSGKTTLVKNTLPLLREEDFRIDGYLSDSFWKNNECLGYNLLDLKEQQTYPFILREGKEDWEKIGPYFFVPESLSRAKQIIHRAKNSDLAVVDEVGPLELEGKGVWPALADALFSSQTDFFLVIRDSVLKELLSILKKDKVLVHNAAEKKSPQELAESLRAGIEKRSPSRSP